MPLITVYIPLRSVILLFKQTLKAPPPPAQSCLAGKGAEVRYTQILTKENNAAGYHH